MTTTAQRATLLAATFATGLAAGFFYAYHVSVTRGLALVDDRTYVDTMQAINATVRNWQFALSFFGALVLGAAALLVRVSRWRSPTTWLVGAAVALYLCAFLITMGLNVPSTRSLPPTPTWPTSTWPPSGPATSRTGTASTRSAPWRPWPRSPAWPPPSSATAARPAPPPPASDASRPAMWRSSGPADVGLRGGEAVADASRITPAGDGA